MTEPTRPARQAARPIPTDPVGGCLGAIVVIGLAGMWLFLLVGVPVLLTEGLRHGERAEVRCAADGTCELRRAGALGSFRTIGRFTENGVVDTTPNCDQVRRWTGGSTGGIDAIGLPAPDELASGSDYETVDVCRPGLWIVDWDGPATPPDIAADAARRWGRTLLPSAELPAGAQFVPFTDRSHDNWDLDPYGLIQSSRPGNQPWSLRFSTARWLPYPVQLVGTVLVSLATAALFLRVVTGSGVRPSSGSQGGR